MRLKRIVPFLLILIITSVFFVFAFGGKAVRSQSAAPCSSTYAPGSYAQRVASGLFDGHTGKIGFQNDKDYPVTVNLYHPDAPDRIFGSYRVESKQNIYLGDNVVIGGDWGIQVEGSGICIVGKVSKFDSYGNGNFF